MTILLVEKLNPEADLIQPFKFNLNTRVNLAGFYPYIYMQGSPDGDFVLGVRKIDDTFFYERNFTSENIREILNTEDGHAHLFLPCVPEYPMQLEKGSYEMYLHAENYSPNRNHFIGWCKQYRDLNNVLDYSPSNDAENPLAFRIKVYKEGIL